MSGRQLYWCPIAWRSLRLFATGWVRIRLFQGYKNRFLLRRSRMPLYGCSQKMNSFWNLPTPWQITLWWWSWNPDWWRLRYSRCCSCFPWMNSSCIHTGFVHTFPIWSVCYRNGCVRHRLEPGNKPGKIPDWLPSRSCISLRCCNWGPSCFLFVPSFSYRWWSCWSSYRRCCSGNCIPNCWCSDCSSNRMEHRVNPYRG